MISRAASGAWLVTGNLKHFHRSARHGVTVVSPDHYLACVAEPQPPIGAGPLLTSFRIRPVTPNP